VHRKFVVLCLKRKRKRKGSQYFQHFTINYIMIKEFLHILLMQISCPTMTQDLANIVINEMLNFNLFVILCVLVNGIICVMKSYFHKLSAYDQIMFKFKECGRQKRKASNMIFNVVKGTEVIPLLAPSPPPAAVIQEVLGK
jgi:hypothetical protein